MCASNVSFGAPYKADKLSLRFLMSVLVMGTTYVVLFRLSTSAVLVFSPSALGVEVTRSLVRNSPPHRPLDSRSFFNTNKIEAFCRTITGKKKRIIGTVESHTGKNL